MPTAAAINFHDGPLPAYAGLNTPVWALLNGESRHGVTWHLMTRRVDEGDIVARREFELADNETALTLNAKCFEAAIDSFEEVLQRIAGGRLGGQAQTAALQRYYRRKDRPAAAGTIDWRLPAHEVARLVRALDYGSYGNPMSIAKAWCGERLFAVGERAGARQPDRSTPGTHRRQRWRHVDRCRPRLRHRTATARDAGRQDAVRRRGDRSARSHRGDRARRRSIRPWRRASARSSRPWPVMKSIGCSGSNIKPSSSCRGSSAALRRRSRATSVRISRSAMPPLRSRRRSLRSSATSRASPTRTGFDVGYADPALVSSVAGIEPWFASQVPLQVRVDFARGFDALSASVGRELSDARRRSTFATDLVARSPELRPAAANRDLLVQPVAVVVADHLDDAAALAGSELTLVLSCDAERCRYLYDANRLDRETVAELHAAVDGTAACRVRRAALRACRAVARCRQRTGGAARPTATRLRSRAACMHRLIEEQVARTPDACRAASAKTARSPTASSIDAPTSSRAGSRRSASARTCWSGWPSSARSRWWSALLAVHKAGGAYVPLDPSYPQGAPRAAWSTMPSVTVLLTQQRWRRELPTHGADGDLGSMPTGRRSPRESADAVRRRRRTAAPGVRDLHLGLDRQAQGRDGRAPQRRQLLRRHGRGMSGATSRASGWR